MADELPLTRVLTAGIISAKWWRGLYLLLCRAEMESVILYRVPVGERDSHFHMAKPMPLTQEHVGHVVVGVQARSVNLRWRAVK